MKFFKGQRVRVTTRRGPPHFHDVAGTVVRYADPDGGIPVRVNLDGLGEYGFAEWELTPLDGGPKGTG